MKKNLDLIAGNIFLSIVIPVFNSEDCLKELCARLIKSLRDLDITYEIILVEDCGDDNSWNLIQELAKYEKYLYGFKLSRNFGQHNALAAGLTKARGSWVIIMDCDLQDKPEDIGRFIAKTKEGFDVVIARSIVRRDSWSRQFASNLFYRCLSLLSGYQYVRGVRPFRIMSRKVVNALVSMHEQTRTIGPLMDWLGFPSAYIDIEVESRYSGSSSYNWVRLLTLALNTSIAFSGRALKISILVGLLMAVLSFIYGMYIVIYSLAHHISAPGWTSLITSLYFIGGLVLINLGIMGLYLDKTFEEAKRRPYFLISHSTKDEINQFH